MARYTQTRVEELRRIVDECHAGLLAYEDGNARYSFDELMALWLLTELQLLVRTRQSPRQALLELIARAQEAAAREAQRTQEGARNKGLGLQGLGADWYAQRAERLRRAAWGMHRRG